MQPLLQPVSPTGITILLWCVCSAAAALVQPGKNNEPQPLPDSPPTPFTVVVRTIPITKELAFEERWQVPAPEAVPPPTIGSAKNVSLQLEPDQQASQPAERPDPVCGSKGRRYFHIGRILSWRCRR
jgi:hypothetical protein